MPGRSAKDFLLAADLDAVTRAEVRAAVERLLAEHRSNAGISLAAASWLVSARSLR